MGRLLVGTTESESDPGEEMIVTKAEAEFLLRHVNRHLVRPFEVSDIVSAIAGMRPLIQPSDARDSQKIARDYEIEVEPQSGLISVLGGKWTLYRAMAEDAINAVELRLRGATSRCRTQDYALFGADRVEDDIKEDLLARYTVEPATIDHLVKKFGSRARDVLELTDNEPDRLELLVEGAPYRRAEAVYCAREEMVTGLEDLLSRRLGIELFDWRMALRAAVVAAPMLADELGWNGSRTQEEICVYTARIHRFLHEIGACAPGEECVDHGANEQSKEC
jgi:glycerol-3-phosphate dehydrogenase